MTSTRRTALITGTGRNLGRAIALRLASSGYDVAINVRSNVTEGEAVAKAAQAFGVKTLVCVGDVGSRDAVRQIAKRALEDFGHVDVLVNVAAFRPARKFLEMTFDEWQTVMDVNVGGVFLRMSLLAGALGRVVASPAEARAVIRPHANAASPIA